MLVMCPIYGGKGYPVTSPLPPRYLPVTSPLPLRYLSVTSPLTPASIFWPRAYSGRVCGGRILAASPASVFWPRLRRAYSERILAAFPASVFWPRLRQAYSGRISGERIMAACVGHLNPTAFFFTSYHRLPFGLPFLRPPPIMPPNSKYAPKFKCRERGNE